MSSAHGEWCTIESDPGVFTELMREFGVKGLQVEELWGLDETQFTELKPVHGLIFLFKWVQEPPNTAKLLKDGTQDIYFAKQVIHNACATQAIVNLLLNTQHSDVQLGQTLSSFKDFTQNFDPMLRGQCLSNSEQIRAVHNSFARNEVFETFGRKAEKEEDVFHFVGYLPVNGRIVELDGLADGPIDHGEIPAGEEWTKAATPVIEQRMQRYMEGEIRFNLLALVSDRKLVLNRRINELQQNYESMPDDNLVVEMNHLKELLEEENAKDLKAKVENLRRKHNFLPFIIELFKALGDSGRLNGIYNEAVKKGTERENRNKKLKTGS
ncbi:ubiquitin carboxyl-terminal hydrolase isozyme L5-like [Paramacrobiotus metropolitanus]|uniref:ubiquitin carboxyl-terminal hydrolase isozyme L5-like n=1 Tax=Paramacrobiotus metropolitanus TaxID=2943436 RepID=UPI002445FFB1|nr:ubiquitin carboxyl-terminal hydrolase isozyme L5-like [Paramacrobiotus metropolitanus]